jgi:hypothetical protein
MSQPLPTENFRRQHDELMQLGTSILTMLAQEGVAQRASEIRRLVARFAGKLNVHARMEGEALYPRLLAHDDDAVRRLATSMVDELGGIYDSFGSYAKRWPDADAIENDAMGFVRHTREVMAILAKRMMRETHDLYPLVDALG